MEGLVFGILFGGAGGVIAGLVGSGLWEAFCLVAQRVEPTSNQITGMALGGGCLGAITLCGLFFAVEVMS